MRHRIFLVAPCLSLLLCAVLIAARAVTIHTSKSAFFRRGPTAYGVCSSGGFLSVARWHFDGPPLDPRMIEFANDYVLTYRLRDGGHGDVLGALGLDFFDESIGRT